MKLKLLFRGLLFAQLGMAPFFNRLPAQVKTLTGKAIPLSTVDLFVKKLIDSLEIPGISIAIISDSRIAWYKTMGIKNEKKELVDFATLFEAASMTKPLFAYSVLALAEKKIIDIDTFVYKYYSSEDLEYDDRYKLITSRMLLSHTSGLPNWRESDLSFIAEPGRQYSYSGEGFELLGKTIRHITHNRLDKIMQEEVLSPCGIENAYFLKNQYVDAHLSEGQTEDHKWGKDPPFLQAHPAYSLYTEAFSYAKFILWLMKQSKQTNSIFNTMNQPQAKVNDEESICLGIFSTKTPFGIKYSHSGNNYGRFNSNFEFYPDKNIGYVYFINCNKGDDFTKKFDEFLANGK